MAQEGPEQDMQSMQQTQYQPPQQSPQPAPTPGPAQQPAGAKGSNTWLYIAGALLVVVIVATLSVGLSIHSAIMKVASSNNIAVTTQPGTTQNTANYSSYNTTANTSYGYNYTSGSGLMTGNGSFTCAPVSAQFNCTPLDSGAVSTMPISFFGNNYSYTINGTSINLWIGQDTGNNWNNVNITYVPQGTKLNSSGVPNVPFNSMYVTQQYSVGSTPFSSVLVLNMVVLNSTSGKFSGSIWARYYLSNSTSPQYIKMATVKGTA